MQNITKNILGLVGASFLTTFALSADGICHHCDEIRLYNAEHHHNYEYYEDYVKSEEGSQAKIVADADNTQKATDKKPPQLLPVPPKGNPVAERDTSNAPKSNTTKGPNTEKTMNYE